MPPSMLLLFLSHSYKTQKETLFPKTNLLPSFLPSFLPPAELCTSPQQQLPENLHKTQDLRPERRTIVKF
jgi:hypothetical protein